MKIIGMIGGIGPESTIEYYRAMIANVRAQRPDGGNPKIIIYSIDLKNMIALITANELNQVAEILVASFESLARAGAEIGLMASNTPHIVFDEVQRRSPISLVSIVEATCEAAKSQGLERLGLFGTRFTMQARFYPDVFTRENLKLVTPTLDEQTFIHDKYMSELLNNLFLDETRKQLLAIVDRMIDQEGIQGLILGGTEIPLILRDPLYRGIPFLDTAQIHVKKIIAASL